jgi:hypothetical protein
MVSATSLNPCHIMVFFAHILNEGLNPMGLNFTGANWVDFFLQGPKSKLGNFTGTKNTFYPNINQTSNLDGSILVKWITMCEF